MVNNNEIEYFLPGPSREINTDMGSNSNLNSRPYNAISPMVNNNETEFFFPPGPSRDSDRKGSVKITNNYKRNLKMYLMVLDDLLE